MQSHLNTVQAAIDRHRQMVAIDESCFDENGTAFDTDTAAKAMEAEVLAFLDFCAFPCNDETDVQAKVDYVISGTVGQREPLIECLFDEAYGGIATQGIFLRSLQTTGAK